MKKTNTVFYDKENDILSIHKGFASDEKFKGNIDAGELILDVSTKGRIKGIEIINATRFFKDLFKGFDIEKDILKNLANAEFNTSIKPNRILLTIIFKVKNIKREIPTKIVVPLENPRMH